MHKSLPEQEPPPTRQQERGGGGGETRAAPFKHIRPADVRKLNASTRILKEGGKKWGVCEEKKKENISSFFIPRSCLRGKYNATVLRLIQDTVVMTGSIFDHAGREMWQQGSNVERDREKQHRGGERPCVRVCVYLRVCVCVCACMVTKQEFMRGRRWIQGKKGGRGGLLLCFQWSGSPCLLPSVESISDCIMLGRQGPSECTP